MQAHAGNEVCAHTHTTVIRSNGEWREYVRSLSFDGERYAAVELRAAGERLAVAEQDAGLFALVGASS